MPMFGTLVPGMKRWVIGFKLVTKEKITIASHLLYHEASVIFGNKRAKLIILRLHFSVLEVMKQNKEWHR